jgi:hypothetical protein
MSVQPFLPIAGVAGWVLLRDGNDAARSMQRRHYSRRRYRDGRRVAKIVGPGHYLMMMHAPTGLALFVWRKFIDDSGQQGVNCAIFRNEGAGRSSDLIREADAIADERWPGERHYTYVDPKKLPRGSNPGYCFLMAGWRRCGVTKDKGLHILERP